MLLKLNNKESALLIDCIRIAIDAQRAALKVAKYRLMKLTEDDFCIPQADELLGKVITASEQR